MHEIIYNFFSLNFSSSYTALRVENSQFRHTNRRKKQKVSCYSRLHRTRTGTSLLPLHLLSSSSHSSSALPLCLLQEVPARRWLLAFPPRQPDLPAERRETPAPSPPPPPFAPPRYPPAGGGGPPRALPRSLLPAANESCIFVQIRMPRFPTAPILPPPFLSLFLSPLAPTLLRSQELPERAVSPPDRLPSPIHCSPRSHSQCLGHQPPHFTYWISFTNTPNLFLLASFRTRYTENKIELHLANSDPVIHQAKLVHRDETAWLFQMHIISSCTLKKNLRTHPFFLGMTCNFAQVKEKTLSARSMCSAGHALRTMLGHKKQVLPHKASLGNPLGLTMKRIFFLSKKKNAISGGLRVTLMLQQGLAFGAWHGKRRCSTRTSPSFIKWLTQHHAEQTLNKVPPSFSEHSHQSFSIIFQPSDFTTATWVWQQTCH